MPVTGLVMTKLDGTAKGGILVALAGRFGLPVHYIGVGEGEDDLQPFVAVDFARALVGADEAHEPADPAAGARSGAFADFFRSLQVSGNIRCHRRFHGGGAAGAGDRLSDGENDCRPCPCSPPCWWWSLAD